MANEFKKKLTDAQRIIQDQQQFEKLISDTASKLAQTGVEQLEGTIYSILRSLGQFFHAKLAFFGQFSKNGRKLNFANIWSSEDLRPDSSTLKIENILETSIRKSPILNRELNKMESEPAGPPDKDRLYRLLEDSGMKSSIIVPVCVQDRSIGLLGLDAFIRPLEYPLAIGDRLQIIADMIGSMMGRIQPQIIS